MLTDTQKADTIRAALAYCALNAGDGEFAARCRDLHAQLVANYTAELMLMVRKRRQARLPGRR